MIFIKIFLDRGVAMIEEAAEAFFNEKDRDHDGKVSFEEFMGQVRSGIDLAHSYS